MNVIQKALEMQNVDVAWSGSLPDTSGQITDTYLRADVGGFPRVVRTDIDAGADIDIIQLRLDFDTLRSASTEEDRIDNIKRKANQVILARYNEDTQRNLTARGFELIRTEQVNGSLTEDELAEVAEIEAVWAWIKDVRSTSNTAETDGTLVHLIGWPV